MTVIVADDFETMALDTSPLPAGWQWARLGQECEINPRRPSGLCRSDDEPTTFVPMTAVDDQEGTIATAEIRPFSEVRKGYTYFQDVDCRCQGSRIVV